MQCMKPERRSKLKNDKCLPPLSTAFQFVLIVFLLWWQHIFVLRSVSLSLSLVGGCILIPKTSLITGKQFSREKCVYFPSSRRIHSQTWIRKLLLNFIYSSLISFVRRQRWSVCPICSIIRGMKNIACYYNRLRILFSFLFRQFRVVMEWQHWNWTHRILLIFKNHYFTFAGKENVISAFEITELSQALCFWTEETFLFRHLYG